MHDAFESPADDNDLNQQGKTAATLGITAVFFAMTGGCSCYLGYLAAIALGAIALMQARTVLAEQPTGEALAYSNVAKWTSLMAIGFSLFVVAVVCLYLGIYIVFIGALATL